MRKVIFLYRQETCSPIQLITDYLDFFLLIVIVNTSFQHDSSLTFDDSPFICLNILNMEIHDFKVGKIHIYFKNYLKHSHQCNCKSVKIGRRSTFFKIPSNIQRNEIIFSQNYKKNRAINNLVETMGNDTNQWFSKAVVESENGQIMQNGR